MNLHLNFMKLIKFEKWIPSLWPNNTSMKAPIVIKVWYYDNFTFYIFSLFQVDYFSPIEVDIEIAILSKK